MKVDGLKITLKKSELDDAECPVNPAWGAGMIGSLGLSRVIDSPRLEGLSRCPEVLKAAGFEVFVEDDEAEPLPEPSETPEA